MNKVILILMSWIFYNALYSFFIYYIHIFLFYPLDPRFIGVHLIPESDNPEDDKIFLFFKENAMDGEHTGKATIARIGQLCKVTTHTNKNPVSLLSNGKTKCVVWIKWNTLSMFSYRNTLTVCWCLQKCFDVKCICHAEWYGRPQESGEQVDHFPQGPANVFSPWG